MTIIFQLFAHVLQIRVNSCRNMSLHANHAACNSTNFIKLYLIFGCIYVNKTGNISLMQVNGISCAHRMSIHVTCVSMHCTVFPMQFDTCALMSCACSRNSNLANCIASVCQCMSLHVNCVPMHVQNACQHKCDACHMYCNPSYDVNSIQHITACYLHCFKTMSVLCQCMSVVYKPMTMHVKCIPFHVMRVHWMWMHVNFDFVHASCMTVRDNELQFHAMHPASTLSM